MIRVAVVDDERAITEKVTDIVKEHFESIKQSYKVKSFQHPEELLQELKRKEYFDVFFLDVEMEINGLDVAKEIRQLYMEPFIVFVTSYKKYSLNGYEYNAYRYIIKENLEEKLPEVLDRIQEQLESGGSKYYVIESPSGVERISYNNLYYLHIQGKYTYFHTRKGNARVRKTLKTVYKELDAEEFVYVDKSYVVNLHHVMELRDKQIIMRGGDKIPVSVPRLKEVKKAIGDFWREKL